MKLLRTFASAVSMAFAVTLLMTSCCSSLAHLVDPRDAVPHATIRYAPPAARYEVGTEHAMWRDDARNRTVPITIYHPLHAGGALPLVIFSHGIGEDRDSYSYLGRYLAARGWMVVHVTHYGTDKSVLQQGYLKLYRATKNPENWRARALDVSFVLDRLERGDAAPLIGAPIDFKRVAVAGHSAGAYTAFAVAGLQLTGGNFRDRRVGSIVAISMPKLNGVVAPNGYDAVTIPVLDLTGTCDTSLLYRTFPRDRRVPFESTHNDNQLLITIEGVSHDVTSAELGAGADPKQLGRQSQISMIVEAFIDATLQNDDAARRWLYDGGAVAPDVAVERRGGAAPVQSRSK
jgi:predicted dienelactone hydrolase